jgi:hypothetical protein
VAAGRLNEPRLSSAPPVVEVTRLKWRLACSLWNRSRGRVLTVMDRRLGFKLWEANKRIREHCMAWYTVFRKPARLVSTIIAVYASLIAICVFVFAYPKLDAYSGGINTPFELKISNPGYLCFYDVNPVCSGINLSFDNGPPPIEGLSVAFPGWKEKICPSKPRTFSCSVSSPSPRAGATFTLSLRYSVHLLPLLPFPKWSMDWTLPCRLGTAGAWVCGEPMPSTR